MCNCSDISGLYVTRRIRIRGIWRPDAPILVSIPPTIRRFLTWPRWIRIIRAMPLSLRYLLLLLGALFLASCGYGALTYEDLDREDGLPEPTASEEAGIPVPLASESESVDGGVAATGDAAALGDFEMGGYSCTLIVR